MKNVKSMKIGWMSRMTTDAAAITV